MSKVTIPSAGFVVETGEFIKSVRGVNNRCDLWRLTDAFGVELIAVAIDGQVVREFDTEDIATMWIAKNA